jgi:iron complex outermembrane receptor protein
LVAWSSYSFQPYKFDNYQQGTTVYSGNALTGVARNTWVTGIEWQWLKHYYLNLSMNAVDPIPLTDANDATAMAYQLVQVKTGYPFILRKWKLHVYAGIDNLLNQAYSLGNDINAAGKRYYNPAAEQNYFLGLNLQFQ